MEIVDNISIAEVKNGQYVTIDSVTYAVFKIRNIYRLVPINLKDAKYYESTYQITALWDGRTGNCIKCLKKDDE